MYQVLARKWRPKNFHELVGQTHVTQALTYALDHNQIHHAYLFTGTRGVGKTTIARIFAKSLNCLKNHISSNPCGECENCIEIDQGRFPDLIEVDAASRTGIDDTKELLDNVPYAPVKGQYKVYLIDEVHMFSKHSYNALLKTLEEPPAHVKFILATTDPQKLPTTILSRCLQFHLKNMSQSQIAAHLAVVLQGEGAKFEDEALQLLADAASGSMRDSLSLLDQALIYGQGKITAHDVAALLGAIPQQQLIALLQALTDADAAAIRSILISFDEYSPDYSYLLQSFLLALQKITIVQLNALHPQDNIPEALQKLAVRLPVELVQLWYQVATETWQNLPYQPDARMALEMGLLRMVALQPIIPTNDIQHSHAIPEAIKDTGEQTELADIVTSLHQEKKTAPDMSAHNINVNNTAAEQEISASDNNAEKVSSPNTHQSDSTDTNDSPPAANISDDIELSRDDIIPPWVEEPPPADEEGTVFPDDKAVNTYQNAPTEINDNTAVVNVTDNVQHNTDSSLSVTSKDKQTNIPNREKTSPSALNVDDIIYSWLDSPGTWSAFLQTLSLDGYPLLLLENSCPHQWHAPNLLLHCDESAAIFDNDANRLQAAQAINQQLGISCTLVIQSLNNVLTPREYRQKKREQRMQDVERDFLTHPHVVNARAVLGQEIQIDNIQPLTE